MPIANHLFFPQGSSDLQNFLVHGLRDIYGVQVSHSLDP
jgi:hypothetical protein